MGRTLTEIAHQLKASGKKVQLIYAFNGTGKTRLSQEFKTLLAPVVEGEGEAAALKMLYYNAFTEDLFYWDNDLENDALPKLKIQPNSFTDWVLRDQGQDVNIIANFQRYVGEKLTPRFNEAFSELTFSYERGNAQPSDHIKISKGEESNFIWSVFFTLLEQVVGVLNEAEPENRDTDQFDALQYIFIDDPVSSLDENHLIQLAVDLAQLVKSSKSELKFIITTHSPLFYNVLYNELNSDKFRMVKFEDESYDLVEQATDSPFSYHLYLKAELEKAIASGQVSKYHFNFLRNILEKTSTFLGYKKWGDLLPKTADGQTNPYEARIINFSSHSKHAGEEVADLTEDDKRVLAFLVRQINEMYRFGPDAGTAMRTEA